ncbi:sodium-dependent multivitamin transporter-like [Saccoglossus kowalevskii]
MSVNLSWHLDIVTAGMSGITRVAPRNSRETTWFIHCLPEFYSALGGMKAVIWTDVFLFMVILIDLILVIVFGTIESGGISYVWQVNKDDGRLAESLFYFPFDLTARTSFLSCMIGGGVSYIAVCVSQTGVQRYISTKTVRQAQLAVMLNLPFQWIFLPLVYFSGLVLYAYYNNYLTLLTPANNGTYPELSANSTFPTPVINVTFINFPPEIRDDGVEPQYEPDYTSSDQILVYFVSDLFGHIHCFVGLFISCIFAGTLSTVSSSLNALVAVTLEDFVKPWRKWRSRYTGKPVYVNDRVDTITGKFLTIGYGVIAILLSYVASKMDTLVTMGATIFGISGGPIVGMFFIGFLYKRSTSWAVISGVIIAFILGCWVAVGGTIYEDELDEVLGIYSLSFLWYSVFTLSLTILIAIPLSEIHRCFSKSERVKSKTVDPGLLAVFMRHKDWKSKYIIEDDDDEIESVDMEIGTKDESTFTSFDNIEIHDIVDDRDLTVLRHRSERERRGDGQTYKENAKLKAVNAICNH